MLVEINTGPSVLTAVKVVKEVLQLSLKDAHDLIYNEKSSDQAFGRLVQFECPDEKFEELKIAIQAHVPHGCLYKIV